MTDRYNYLTVFLEKDIRADDAEALVSAIRQLRGVLDVKPNVSDSDAQIAIIRARTEIIQRLWDVLKE